MFLNALIVLLLAAALGVIALNWGYAGYNLRNRRRGIDRQYSMVVFVPQILLALAWFAQGEQAPWLSARVFVVIALADISLWAIAWWLLSGVRRAGATDKR